MARRRPGLKESIGLGAVAGLLAALALGTAGAGIGPVPLVVGGMVLGLLHNFWRFPDDRTCRIPWWLRGCGGETTIKDTDGHSRPRPPCWGHPDGKPKRLVNVAVVVGEVVLAVALVAVAVAAAAGQA